MKHILIFMVGLLLFLSTPTKAQSTSPQTLRLCMSEIAAMNMLQRRVADDEIPPQFAGVCEHVMIRQLHPKQFAFVEYEETASKLGFILILQFCGERGCIYLYAPMRVHKVNVELLVYAHQL